jgi:antibiotic biosynthesis monooxygenase (ABM) superfamily enzyme
MALTQCSRAQADCSASTELTTGSEEDQAVQDNDIRNQPVTAMFTDRVRPDKIADYDAWSAGINADVRTFPGFISVDVIRPTADQPPEYITLVKFDGCDNLKRWKESPNLARWAAQLPELLSGASDKQERAGIELWFDRPQIATIEEPAFWKRVLVAAVCVYPLVSLLGLLLLLPITGSLPPSLALLIQILCLSTLLTWPVMLWVTRWLRPWLYPQARVS